MAPVFVRTCPSEATQFWPHLSRKLAAALAICLGFQVLWAQALAQQPAGPAIPEEVDGRGYKMLAPLPSLYTAKDARIQEPKFRNQMKGIVDGAAALAENQSKFIAYYTGYYFPFMTRTGDRELRDLGEERNRFLRLLDGSKNQEAHTLLISLALNAMTPIVRDDKFHPAVRYNAMALISGLNDREAVRQQGGGSPPVPMVRALPIILEEFNRPTNSDAIKVAALLGLARHLEWDNERPAGAQPIDAGLRAEVVKALTALAQAKDPPVGRSEEGHVWLRRRAVEALGFAALKKPDPEVATLLDSLLKDESQPVALRCTAASMIGRISYQAPAKIDPQATAKELGYLAMVACDTELNRLATLKKDEIEHSMRLMGQIPDPNMAAGAGGMAMGMPGGGYGGLSGEGGYGGGYGGMAQPGSIRGTTQPGLGTSDGGYGTAGGYGTPGMMDPTLMDPKAYRFDPARRRIRQQLYCVQLGLTGGEDMKPATGGAPATKSGAGPGAAQKAEPRGMYVLAKAGSPEQKYVENVYGSVRKLIEVVETKALDVTQLEKDLRKEIKNVETAIGRKLIPAGSAAPAAAVATDDVPGGAAPPGKAPPGQAPAGKAPAGKAAAPAPPGKAAPTPAAAPKPGPMPQVKAAAAVGK